MADTSHNSIARRPPGGNPNMGVLPPCGNAPAFPTDRSTIDVCPPMCQRLNICFLLVHERNVLISSAREVSGGRKQFSDHSINHCYIMILYVVNRLYVNYIDRYIRKHNPQINAGYP